MAALGNVGTRLAPIMTPDLGQKALQIVRLSRDSPTTSRNIIRLSKLKVNFFPRGNFSVLLFSWLYCGSILSTPVSRFVLELVIPLHAHSSHHSKISRPDYQEGAYHIYLT